MATIIKVERKCGVSYKAIIRKSGKVLKTKIFTRKGDAKSWARRIEADQEQMVALGSSGAGISFVALAEEYISQWSGQDTQYIYRLRYWTKERAWNNLSDSGAGFLRPCKAEKGVRSGLRNPFDNAVGGKKTSQNA